MCAEVARNGGISGAANRARLDADDFIAEREAKLDRTLFPRKPGQKPKETAHAARAGARMEIGSRCDRPWILKLNRGTALSRAGNNPKRRIASADCATDEAKQRLETNVRYVGSGHHKRSPSDYRLPRTNPRPTKSLCDLGRTVKLGEAKALLADGIRMGLFSEIREDGFPKFIWSVSERGEVFEAKTDANGTGEYHGYPLEDEDAMRDYVVRVWKERCQEIGQ